MTAHAVRVGAGEDLGGIALRGGLLVAALAVGALATQSPLLAVMLVCGVIFLYASFKNVAAGLVLFTILTFFLGIPGTPQSGLSLIKIAGGVLALSWLLAVATQRLRARLLTRDHPLIAYALLLLVGWALCSALWAENPGGAISAALRLSQGVALVFILYTALAERREIRWIVWAFVAGAMLTALIGLSGGSSAESFSPYADTARLTGQIGDPNELAAALVPALAFAAFMLVSVTNPVVRVGLVSAVLLLMTALFLTESRGGIVALAATFLATPFLAGPVRARAMALILVVVPIGVSYFVLVAPPEAVQRITHFSAGGGTGRTDLWGIALDMTANHPVGGVGAGNFQTIEPRYALADVNLPYIDLVVDTPKVAHNTYLHVLAELGVVGLLAFLTVLGGSLLVGWRAVKRLARTGYLGDEVLARGVLIGVIGMLAASTFISSQNGKQLWLLIGLALALDAMARRVALRPPELPAESSYDLLAVSRPTEEKPGRAAQVQDLVAAGRRLDRRRRALGERELELKERVRKLDVVERERTAVAQRIARGIGDVAKQRSALAADRKQSEERLAAAKSQLREIETRVAQLEERAAELAAEARDRERLAADQEQLTAALAEREQAVETQAAELQAREAEGRELLEREGAKLQQRLGEERRALETARTALGEERAAVEGERAALAAQRAMLGKQARKELGERAVVLEQELAERRAQLEQELAQRELEFTASERRAAKQRAALEADLASRRKALEKEIERQERAVAARNEAIEQEANKQRNAMESERARRLQALEQDIGRERLLTERAEALEREEVEQRTARERQLAERRRGVDEDIARERGVGARSKDLERETSEPPTTGERELATTAPPGLPSSEWNVDLLERLVAKHGAAFPDRAEEWSYYLIYLRGFAGPDGRLPSSFDGLVVDVFGDAIARERRGE